MLLKKYFGITARSYKYKKFLNVIFNLQIFNIISQPFSLYTHRDAVVLDTTLINTNISHYSYNARYLLKLKINYFNNKIISFHILGNLPFVDQNCI